MQCDGNSAHIDILLSAGTYTISFNRNTNVKLYLRIGKVDSGYITEIESASTSKTFYFSADVDSYLRISIFGKILLSNIQIELGSTVSSYEPYCGEIPAPNPYYPIMPKCNDGVFKVINSDNTWDGSQATAPELRAIPGTDIRDKWNPQTGMLTRAIWKEIVFDGSEDETWSVFNSRPSYGFYNWKGLPEKMSRNACISNYFGAQKAGDDGNGSKSMLWCGVDTPVLYVINPGNFFDESLPDYGLANWKTHLAKYPLRIWVARNKRLITYTAPQKLTMPNGYGQIVQVSGSVPDCPLDIRYLTHAGGAK